MNIYGSSNNHDPVFEHNTDYCGGCLGGCSTCLEAAANTVRFMQEQKRREGEVRTVVQPKDDTQ